MNREDGRKSARRLDGGGQRQRGMVTAELAIGILSATMLAIGLCWSISLIVIHTECADAAAQIARAEARDDATASAQATQHVPGGATIAIDHTDGQERVTVSVLVSLGHVFRIQVSGTAVMPKEPG